MIFKRPGRVIVLEILKYWRQPNFCHLNNVQWKYYLLLFETCFSQSPNNIFWVCSYAYSRHCGVPARNLWGTKVLISSAFKCVGCWWLSLKFHQFWDIKTPQPNCKGSHVARVSPFHRRQLHSAITWHKVTKAIPPWTIMTGYSGSRVLHRIGWDLSCNLMIAQNFPLCDTAFHCLVDVVPENTCQMTSCM